MKKNIGEEEKDVDDKSKKSKKDKKKAVEGGKESLLQRMAYKKIAVRQSQMQKKTKVWQRL